jgi:lactate dehydrogenase-like 2-hydroxyacid dehydrogenase
MTERARLLLTRRLPEAVEARLGTAFDVDVDRADRRLDRATLVAAMRRYDAICPTITDRFDAEMLATPGATVRILANFGAGLDHIDLAAARAAGIAVTNTPDALTDATADLAILLILMTSRRAGEGERELRAGLWTGWRPTHLMGSSLSGKTLGLVGFGRIAQATAARARAIGMRIAYHSRRDAGAADARYVPSLATLAAEADVLSLHVPGGTATRHMVDAALLSAMRRSAILINTARGSVVDEAALVAALRAGGIAGAGLDVFEREPQVHPDLLGCENAVLLPHLGSATIETRTAMGMQAADNLDAWLAARELPHRVA